MRFNLIFLEMTMLNKFTNFNDTGKHMKKYIKLICIKVRTKVTNTLSTTKHPDLAQRHHRQSMTQNIHLRFLIIINISNLGFEYVVS